MAKTSHKKEKTQSITETKEERFLRIATPRVNKAVKSISVVGYCAGAGYGYTPEQVQQIVDTLFVAVQSLSDRFAVKQNKQSEFTFNG